MIYLLIIYIFLLNTGGEAVEILHYGIDYGHAKGEFCPKMTYPYYLLSCFLTPFVYESENTMRRGNAGDILIMEPHKLVYHGPVDDTECFVNDWIKIRGDDFEKLLEKYPLPLNVAFPIRDSNLLKDCILELMEESSMREVGYEEKMSCCLTKTVIQMHRLEQKRLYSARESKLVAARNNFLRYAERDWSLEEMAQCCGYSVSRFSALYKKQFKISPKADLIKARIDRAKRLLHYSELSITEISEKCGFRSIYFFSKYFKEVEGMTPSEYGKRTE